MTKEGATFICLECAVVKCEDEEDLQCEGKDYHTSFCPFHSLAYEIECHERAEMAKMLVQAIWLEASHNVFMGLRPNEAHQIAVSTKLALLQSNMTYLYEKRGPQYHWVVELFRLLKLQICDGVALEAFNEQSLIPRKQRGASAGR